MINEKIISEISLLILQSKEGELFKVSKRIPCFSIVETKIFSSLEEAKKQFNEWLKE